MLLRAYLRVCEIRPQLGEIIFKWAFIFSYSNVLLIFLLVWLDTFREGWSSIPVGIKLYVHIPALLSGFLNHRNGAEGIHKFGDLCKYGQFRQVNGEAGASSVPIPPLKQTNKLFLSPFNPNKQKTSQNSTEILSGTKHCQQYLVNTSGYLDPSTSAILRDLVHLVQ